MNSEEEISFFLFLRNAKKKFNDPFEISVCLFVCSFVQSHITRVNIHLGFYFH